MAHTIISNVCEGIADCVDACPVACIHPGQGANQKELGSIGSIFKPASTAEFVCRYVRWRERFCKKKDPSCNNAI